MERLLVSKTLMWRAAVEKHQIIGLLKRTTLCFPFNPSCISLLENYTELNIMGKQVIWIWVEWGTVFLEAPKPNVGERVSFHRVAFEGYIQLRASCQME